jgi:hypothetical protein
MSNEVGEPDGLPVGPLSGAIRISADGRLEIYRDNAWQPLVRVSDADLPPITRVVESADEVAPSAEDSGGEPDRQAPP